SSKQFSLSTLWSLYGATALIVGIRSRWRWLRFGALGLLALTTLYVLMVAIDQHLIAGRTPIFNQTFGGFAFLIAALVCAVWFYSRSEDREVPERALLIPVILVAANILAIIAFSLEA